MAEPKNSSKRTTLFKQLIVNVLIPVVLAVLLLGGINYFATRALLKSHSNTRNSLVSNTITQVLRFQDITLSVLDENINARVGALSEYIVDYVFKSTRSIEQADLHQLRASLGLDSSLFDFYILNSDGIVVNTTFRPDMGLNFFAFGEEHEQLLRSVLRGDKFVSEKFTIEAATRRMKKYTYQATRDHRYILEIGVRSATADSIIDLIKNTLNDLSSREPSILSAELFMNADDPFSLTKQAPLDPDECSLIKARFERRDTLQIDQRDAQGRYLSRQYLFMEMGASELYKGSVVRIVCDRTDEIGDQLVRLGSYLAVLLLVVLIICVVVLRKAHAITDPIKKLVNNVDIIAAGNLSERAEVEGNNEITTLSVQFNSMIAQLEELYTELDCKVRERTAEVVAQKDEIERQKDELEQQRDVLEVNRKHVTDSILYARRLQSAMLPSPKRIAAIFPDTFIMLRPKDIVSGDFYWFQQIGNKRMFAAVDCTGHGVPGAMVSMVGYNWLNYAVNDLHQDDPVDILNTLSDGVMETFRQHEGYMVHDGMDLALCSVDYSTMQLEFSGAFNPALIVRRGEVQMLKADKLPIGVKGKLYSHGSMVRTKQVVSVEPGDMVYVFSDGYADQFNPHRRKFQSGRFRELLRQIAELPSNEQLRSLEETLTDWMGAHEEQIDDILVVGVRI